MKFQITNKKQFFVALAGLTLSLVTVSQGFAREKEADISKTKTGVASWYHDDFHGKKTANGETFSQVKMTCASNKYPLGTWLKVTNVKNGKSVIVKVNDRMSPKTKRTVDLSRSAAKQIGIEKSGVGEVKIESFDSKSDANS